MTWAIGDPGPIAYHDSLVDAVADKICIYDPDYDSSYQIALEIVEMVRNSLAKDAS